MGLLCEWPNKLVVRACHCATSYLSDTSKAYTTIRRILRDCKPYGLERLCICLWCGGICKTKSGNVLDKG
jgi:hypothetical protein